MSDRLAVYGTFVATAGENIAYGTTGGKEIVLQLIIDDGVTSRGHRDNIFKPEFKVLGSWTHSHLTFTTETVIDYTGGITSNNNHAIIQNIDCTPVVATTATTDASTTTGTTTTCTQTAAAATAACVDQTTAEIKVDELPFNATQQQKDMLLWHNNARTNASLIVTELETMLTYFGTGTDDKLYSAPGKTPIRTNEGAPAV